MKKIQILKTCTVMMVAALVLCGCSADGTSGDATGTEPSVENPSETQDGNELVGDDASTGGEAEGSENASAVGEAEGSENASAGGETEVSENGSETVKSCEEIYEEIAAAVTLQSPMVVPEDFVANYGIDFSAIDDYIFVMSELSTSVETIAIFKSEDTASLENVADALQTFADGKRAEMENYLPEQFDIVDRSSIKTNGNYVYLVISENAEEIEEIIAACLP